MTETRVILLDDDAESRTGIAQSLRRAANFVVDDFEDAGSMLSRLREVERNFYVAALVDLVLKDPVRHSRVEGLSVLREIRAIHPLLPTIAITGLEPDRAAEALTDGAYRYMSKPVDLADLVATIHNLVKQDAALRNLVVGA